MKDGLHAAWLRDENNHPVTCVAMELKGDTARFSVATWNPEDQFNRSLGRDKAFGRLKARKRVSPIVKVPEGVNAWVAVLTAIANADYCPLAKECARRRLELIQQV